MLRCYRHFKITFIRCETAVWKRKMTEIIECVILDWRERSLPALLNSIVRSLNMSPSWGCFCHKMSLTLRTPVSVWVLGHSTIQLSSETILSEVIAFAGRSKGERSVKLSPTNSNIRLGCKSIEWAIDGTVYTGGLTRTVAKLSDLPSYRSTRTFQRHLRGMSVNRNRSVYLFTDYFCFRRIGSLLNMMKSKSVNLQPVLLQLLKKSITYFPLCQIYRVYTWS